MRMWYLLFCLRLISLNKDLQAIDFPENNIISFFFTDESGLCAHTTFSLSIHLLVDI